MGIRLPALELTITSSDWTKFTLLTGASGIACQAPATFLVVRSGTYHETEFWEFSMRFRTCYGQLETMYMPSGSFHHLVGLIVRVGNLAQGNSDVSKWG
jgi:hypothetical protein